MKSKDERAKPPSRFEDIAIRLFDSPLVYGALALMLHAVWGACVLWFWLFHKRKGSTVRTTQEGKPHVQPTGPRITRLMC